MPQQTKKSNAIANKAVEMRHLRDIQAASGINDFLTGEETSPGVWEWVKKTLDETIAILTTVLDGHYLRQSNDQSLPDMGYEQESSIDGITDTYITDHDLSNCRVLENVRTEEGAIRTTTSREFQIYLDGSWQNVVTGFVFREDPNFGYCLEHKPSGFSDYIEIMSGNSLENLGLNGLPIVQGYKVSMGAYPYRQIVDGGTF